MACSLHEHNDQMGHCHFVVCGLPCRSDGGELKKMICAHELVVQLFRRNVHIEEERSVSTGHPRGNQVDGLPRATSRWPGPQFFGNFSKSNHSFGIGLLVRNGPF